MMLCPASPQGEGGASVGVSGALGLLGAAAQAVPTGLSPLQAEAAGNADVVTLIRSLKDGAAASPTQSWAGPIAPQ